MAKNGQVIDIHEEKAEEIWQELSGDLKQVIRIFGGLLFLPVILLLGLGYGLRAGIIAGTEQTLILLKTWWGEEK
jgi:hypothetical protein